MKVNFKSGNSFICWMLDHEKINSGGNLFVCGEIERNCIVHFLNRKFFMLRQSKKSP